MIYDPKLVEILVQKDDQYPNDVVALSGGNLRSHFRQISRHCPTHNRHPLLYYYMGGIDSHGDQVVDIVQGFMGVLVRLSFPSSVDWPGIVPCLKECAEAMTTSFVGIWMDEISLEDALMVELRPSPIPPLRTLAIEEERCMPML